MKDAFGRELEIGQRVAYVWSGGSGVHKNLEYVVGFSPKMVRTSRTEEGVGSCVYGSNCIILSEEGL